MPSNTKSVLILGGAGFLGANLVRRVLQESDVALTVVDSLDPRFFSSEKNLTAVADKIKFLPGDIRDDKLLAQVIPGQDIIFNLAAQTSHPYSLEKPILDAEINVIGTLNVLEAVRKLNPKARLVYSSSSTLIGKAVGDLVDESHGEKPLDIYSANKGVAEKYHRIYNRVYDIPTVVLRFANLYGPYGKPTPAFGFVNYFISQAREGKTISIYGDGLQTRNVMYAADAAEVLWVAANESKLIGEAFFAAHYDHYTVKEISEMIVEVFGRGSIEFVSWPDVRKRIEIEKVLISSARLHYLTGWKPKYGLREGLMETKRIMESGS